MLLRLIDRRADQRGGGAGSDPGRWAAAATELFGWDDEQFTSWWTGSEADAAHAWRAAGRPAQDVDGLIVWAVNPEDRGRLPDLDDGEVVAWCRAVALSGAAAVDRIRLWRSVGLTVPPERTLHYLRDLTDEQIRAWSAAGFDAEWMRHCAGRPIAEAAAWRTAGFTAQEVSILRDCDSALTPGEAAAFTPAGMAFDRLVDWVKHGFDAHEANEYSLRGVQPNEARVWRSMRLGPQDVTDGQLLPPRIRQRGMGETRGPTDAGRRALGRRPARHPGPGGRRNPPPAPPPPAHH